MAKFVGYVEVELHYEFEAVDIVDANLQVESMRNKVRNSQLFAQRVEVIDWGIVDEDE